jgi:hypothetical protein
LVEFEVKTVGAKEAHTVGFYFYSVEFPLLIYCSTRNIIGKAPTKFRVGNVGMPKTDLLGGMKERRCQKNVSKEMSQKWGKMRKKSTTLGRPFLRKCKYTQPLLCGVGSPNAEEALLLIQNLLRIIEVVPNMF